MGLSYRGPYSGVLWHKAYIGKAYTDKVYIDRAYIGKAYINRAYINRIYINKAYINKKLFKTAKARARVVDNIKGVNKHNLKQ